MEGQFRVLNQGQHTERLWTNSRGESITIKSCELELTDGIDIFLCECNDALAEDLKNKPLTPGSWVRVQCTMQTNEGKAQDGQSVRKFMRIRVNRLARL